MIFTNYTDKLFFADIFLHLEFSFIISSIIFHLLFRKDEKERIDKALKDTLETNILSGISTKTAADTDNLKVLKKTYANEDFYDRSFHYLKKSSWTTIVLISVLIMIFSLQLRNEPGFLSLVYDKILLFSCIGILLYLQESLINSNFNIVYEKDLYDKINKNLKNLKTSTTY